MMAKVGERNMKKIIVSIIVIGLLLSTTSISISGEEIKKEQESPLVKELEYLLAFEGITPEQIIETLPKVDGSKEQLPDIGENPGELLLPKIRNIEETLDLMMAGGTPASPVSNPTNPVGNGDTEYWAVLIGVDFNWCSGVSTLPFDENVEMMYNTLLVSDHWQKDHIKVLTNEDATLINIIVVLLWLDLMDDSDDISLVYYTAHGSQLGFDLPPFDEEDGSDEFLTTYWTGLNPFSIVTDDLLNYLLNRLDSQGIAVLIDACYSGGMIDSNQQNARVMMSCCEENESGAGINFAKYIMKGMQGYADDINEEGNDDGIVSAEEAFAYGAPRYLDQTNGYCHPVIDDRYDGELTLTDVGFPPDPPVIDGPLVGKVNTVHNYQVSATDPDGDNIRYGWDWNALHGKEIAWYTTFEPVDFEVEEWTSYYLSGSTASRYHSWDKPGVYDIRARSQDTSGVVEFSPKDYWSDDWTTIITSEDELVDQFQTEDISAITVKDDLWCAQSFIPSLDKLSKVTLELKYSGGYCTVDFFIRSNLNGDNLVETSKNIGGGCSWIDFVFPEGLSVTPGKTYYIVLEIQNGDGPKWEKSNQDPYPRGKAYASKDSGQSWSSSIYFLRNVDFCFVVGYVPSSLASGQSTPQSQPSSQPSSQQSSSNPSSQQSTPTSTPVSTTRSSPTNR